MLKQGILNPQINYHLSHLGHMDTVIVSDVAMELPADLNRVDLVFTPGIPEIVSVVRGMLDQCIVEKAYMAEEMKEYSPELVRRYLALFEERGVPVEYIPHSRFCELTAETKLAVRTGEFHYHYSSVILVSGCPY